MPPPDFRCSNQDEASIAEAIERDAAALGPEATLARYLDGVAGLADMPIAFEAAVHSVLRSQPGDPLAAAQRLSGEHADLADFILAAALGLGISGEAGDFKEGALLFGRFRIVEMIGDGATASTARAKDELLSTPDRRVEALVKRFDDAAGADSRVHAVREARMLLAAPPGVAPRPVALHAAPGEAAYLVTEFTFSHPARSVDDIVHALPLVRELHESGVCHGDLKPQHIRIGEDGAARLIDFGAAAPATTEGRREDLIRLASSAGILAKTRLERSLTGVAERQSRRGGIRTSAVTLRLASRAWRRRAARDFSKVCAAFLLAAAIGALVGWLSRPTESKVRTSIRAIRSFADLGRPVGAELDSSGTISSVWVEIPELSALGDQKAFFSKGLRFYRDGRVDLNLIDPSEIPSQDLPSGH